MNDEIDDNIKNLAKITAHPLMPNTGQVAALFGIANRCQLTEDIWPFREHLKPLSLSHQLPTRAPSIQLSNLKIYKMLLQSSFLDNNKLPISESRDATTAPAEPPPTTIKSYSGKRSCQHNDKDI